jgi:hypothetical protein
MPFTVSPGSYQGGNFLFAGLSGAGKGVTDALDKLNENRKLDAYNDTVVQHALANGQISQEDYDKYVGSSRTRKTGIVAGIAANFIEDYRRQELAAQEEQRKATSELRAQQAAAFNWAPDEAAKQAARWTNNELVQTGPGKFALAPYGGSGQDQVVTDPLTISGQQIPGIGVNRKTGQYVYYGGMQGGGVQVQTDPKTNLPYYVDQKGTPHFLSTQQVMAGNMMPSNSPAPSATPGFISRQLQHLFGGGSSPTPTPSSPVEAGVSPDAGSATTPTPAAAQPLPQDQAQAIKQAFKAGKISRADAIKALRALGFQ